MNDSSSPRALIVDDSKTAQMRLKKMLQHFSVEIDMVASAEDAFSYLQYEKPSIIFMDHHMEGMDGLDALRIIKDNPATAMIPVVMYTSESGDVYIGQARALGALDILSKEVIGEENLEEVLSKLNIKSKASDSPSKTDEAVVSHANSGSDEAATHSAREDMPDTTADTTSSHELDHQRLRMLAHQIEENQSQLARILDRHTEVMNEQLAENTRFLSRRISDNYASLRKQLSSGNQAQVAVPAESNQEGEEHDSIDQADQSDKLLIESSQSSQLAQEFGLLKTLMALALLGLFAVGVLAWQALSRVNQQNEALDLALNLYGDRPAQTVSASADNSNQTLVESIEPRAIDIMSLLDAFSWAMNHDMQIPFGEEPFNQERLLALQTLVFQLDNAGYRGIIDLDIHLGNYCMEQRANGTLALAADNLPLNECYFSQEDNADLSVEDITTLPYLQFEQTADPLAQGRISLVPNVVGYSNPIQPYPARNEETNAAEWNQAASENNEILIRLGVSSDLL